MSSTIVVSARVDLKDLAALASYLAKAHPDLAHTRSSLVGDAVSLLVYILKKDGILDEVPSTSVDALKMLADLGLEFKESPRQRRDVIRALASENDTQATESAIQAAILDRKSN